jgi:hypothetical protein
MPAPLSILLPDSIKRIAVAPDRKLAWEFFIFFSRFEYALKRHPKFLQPGIGNAEPNWDRFASIYNETFLKKHHLDLEAAIKYYIDHPPKKQLRADGIMSWSEPLVWDEREAQLIWLLRVIRTVRNNLFHGGKFPLIPMSDPSRDRDLLSHAITILAFSLKLDREVEFNFNEGINE